MTTQERVRRAIAATADQINATSIPPFRVPQEATRRFADQSRPSVRQMPRWRGGAHHLPVWLAPAAAAAAVALIATATLVISNAVARRPHAGGAGQVAVPRYYIAITRPADEAAIYDTRTGALIARVVPPGNARRVTALTAAANDRTFAIAVPVRRQGPTVTTPTRFYLVGFSPNTGAVRITPVPLLRVPGYVLLAGFALSPSGGKLAVAYIREGGPKYASVLRVMDLATGAIRTWSSPRGEFLRSGANPLDLSWADDNTTLAFNWFGFTLTPRRQLRTSGLWLLDTAKSGGRLLADSRRALDFNPRSPSFTMKGGYLVSNPVLAPDGKTIVAAVSSKPLGAGYVWFARYDAANGRLEHVFDRTLLRRASWSPSMTVLWTSGFGNLLVVNEPPRFKGKLGVVRQSGHVIVLPGGQEQVREFPGPAW